MIRFKHTCDKCSYIGSSDEYDHYYCSSGPLRGSCLFVYGDDGPDYISIPFSVFENQIKEKNVSNDDMHYKYIWWQQYQDFTRNA